MRVDLVTEQFGEFLEGVTLPAHWREEVHRRMVETLEQAGHNSLDLARERERLKLKRARILKQHRDGYISDRDLQTEVAGVDFTLSKLAVPEADGVKLDAVIEGGESLPGIAALWKVACRARSVFLCRCCFRLFSCTWQCPSPHRCILQPTRIPLSGDCASVEAVVSPLPLAFLPDLRGVPRRSISLLFVL